MSVSIIPSLHHPISPFEFATATRIVFGAGRLAEAAPIALQFGRRALVVIGDNQDELSAECRWALKTLRQRAGILLALDPRVAPIAAEIRVRTQEALRNPAGHEGARH